MSDSTNGLGYLVYKVNPAAQTAAEICAQIAMIDAIITELFTTALTSVQTGNVAEYEIDTGQSKQRVKYTSVGSVHRAIRGYSELRAYFANKLTPRNVRLMDSKNFKHNGHI